MKLFNLAVMLGILSAMKMEISKIYALEIGQNSKQLFFGIGITLSMGFVVFKADQNFFPNW